MKSADSIQGSIMEAKEPITTARMYRQLGLRIRNLIVHPAREWQNIHNQQASFNDMMSTFALPLIGMVALATFISHLINQQAFIIELALKRVGVEFAALFGGLFVAWFFIFRVMKYFHFVSSRDVAARLAIYSSSALYLVLLLTALVPEVFFLQIFMFYAFFLIWTGVEKIDGPTVIQKNWFTLVAGLAVLGFPFLIRTILLNLITI